MSAAADARTMTGRLVRVDEIAAQPWRNGGGLTRELFAWPSAQDWIVRVSVAEVTADGPFSRFAGTQRWFAVLDGVGVELTIDGDARELGRGDAPACFSGDAATACRLLDGPTRDLNLMLRGARGEMVSVTNATPWRPRAAQCGLFAAVPGLIAADGREQQLPAGALLWFAPAPAVLSFAAEHAGPLPTGFWLAVATTGDR